MVVRVLAKELLQRLGKLWVLKSRARAAMGDGRWATASGKDCREFILLELKSDAAATSAILPCKPRSALCSRVAPLLLLRQYLRIDLVQGLEQCKWQRKAVPREGPLNLGSETRRKFWPSFGGAGRSELAKEHPTSLLRH